MPMIEQQLADSINRKARDHRDFAIVDEECYFCGQKETVRFNEHYTFCPGCSAIYTNMIIQESSCDHVKAGVPLLLREPWYNDKNKYKAHIYEDEIRREDISQELIRDVQRCSICGKECVADGW